MSSPVVVSRIQNRRGTQDQFNALYPAGYNGISGFNGYTVPATPVIGASGTGTIATLNFASSPNAVFPVNSQIIVSSVNPSAYNGTFVVTASTSTSVSYSSTATATYVSSGAITIPFNIINYPEVLMPGELALCTDTSNIYMGNLNGGYVKVGEQFTPSDIVLQPIMIVLPPTPTFTVIPQLTYTGTPFMTILYDLTDSLSSNWNALGTNFSRNGQMQITVLNSTPSPVATLTDTSTEINNLLPNEISFEAQFDEITNQVSILYMSTFLIPITLSTSTINWLTI